MSDVLCQHSEVVLWDWLSVQMFFWWICGEKVVSLSYSSTILGPPKYVISKPCCCCSVAQLCPILCNPMDCSASGFPVLHYLPEFAQTHVWVGDDIQPCHRLLPSSKSLIISITHIKYNELGSQIHLILSICARYCNELRKCYKVWRAYFSVVGSMTYITEKFE